MKFEDVKIIALLITEGIISIPAMYIGLKTGKRIVTKAFIPIEKFIFKHKLINSENLGIEVFKRAVETYNHDTFPTA